MRAPTQARSSLRDPPAQGRVPPSCRCGPRKAGSGLPGVSPLLATPQLVALDRAAGRDARHLFQRAFGNTSRSRPPPQHRRRGADFRCRLRPVRRSPPWRPHPVVLQKEIVGSGSV
jgi:hypothetical protein